LNVGGSNILFTNGHYDPWHLLGLNADPEYAEKQNVHAVTYMAAHCAPMDAPDPTDPPSLIEARKKIVAWIGDLLAKN
jgi:serine protease 16